MAGSAAAAYGLRNLSSSYDGNVVEVRRSSDDTTRDFTATEVTDGTLVGFCWHKKLRVIRNGFLYKILWHWRHNQRNYTSIDAGSTGNLYVYANGSLK